MRATTNGDDPGATPQAPRLSIVVIVFRMARQALNTLYTLSPAYQRDVSPHDYEVVVVENESDDGVNRHDVVALGDRFRYIRRKEEGVSPARAINEGLAACRGRYIGLMIDGARMVTPRVVRFALEAFAVTERAVVAVPGYHLGRAEHHRNVEAGYDEAVERALLASVDWRKDGYRLFEIGCFSGGNRHGYFHPFMESNCMFASRGAFEEIGGADERFGLPGGGALNLHMYRSLGLLPGTRLFLLVGEGSFHQYHGGVTTAGRADREEVLRRQRDELRSIWGGAFQSLRREAVLLGGVNGRTMPFLAWSAVRGHERHERMRRTDQDPWPDEPGG